MIPEYQPVFPCRHSDCGYFNSLFNVCGLIPEHCDILCPFGVFKLKGGDDDGKQLYQDDLP